MNPLHIALVHPYSWSDVRRGGERYLADLSWYLASAGHRVDVITGKGGTPSAKASDSGTIGRVRNDVRRRLELHGLSRDDSFAVVALRRLLRARYDLVHVLTPAAALASLLSGQRTIYNTLGHPAPELIAGKPRANRRILCAAVRHAHVVAAPSQAAAGAVEATFGRRAAVLYPALRLEAFPLELKPRRGPPRLLFPAYFSNPHKGLETVLKAFVSLRRRHADARLVLAGTGDPGWALERLRGEERAALSQIDVLGVVEDVARLYREATVTMLPSLYEAFGLVLVESMASGTPVVASNTQGGGAEIVDRPEIGRAVPYGDPEALAVALHETILLAADPLTAPRCRAQATRWSWDRIGPEHEALYERVALAPRRTLRSDAGIT